MHDFIRNFYVARRVKEFDRSPMASHIKSEREAEENRKRIVEKRVGFLACPDREPNPPSSPGPVPPLVPHHVRS